MDKVILDFQSVRTCLEVLFTVERTDPFRTLRFPVITIAVEPAIGPLGTEINHIKRIICPARVIFKRRLVICFYDKCVRPEFFNDLRAVLAAASAIPDDRVCSDATASHQQCQSCSGYFLMVFEKT